MGAVLRGQNALPYGTWITENLTAKDDVDNVGAGRAAKGAIPVASTKNRRTPFGVLRFFVWRWVEKNPRIIVGSREKRPQVYA